jgi:hypothetical protein
LETYIRGTFFGLGDKRGTSSDGGSYKTSIRFSIDTKDGRVSGLETDIGSTSGKKGIGGVDVTRKSDGNGGWNLTLTGSALNGSGKGAMIDYNISLNISSEGTVTVTGGAHDGFPSIEGWSYNEGSEPKQFYDHAQGMFIRFLKLFGDSDTKVPVGEQ